jgi:hypothetical protein
MGLDKVNQVGASLAGALVQPTPDLTSSRLANNGAPRDA